MGLACLLAIYAIAFLGATVVWATFHACMWVWDRLTGRHD